MGISKRIHTKGNFDAVAECEKERARMEARQIALQNLERAEQERSRFAEEEAQRGVLDDSKEWQ